MTIYYVSNTGSDSANGSATTPWKTISNAMRSSSLKPGDTVMVRPGTYDEPYGISMKSGSAAGDITLKSEIPGAALIRSDSYAAVYMGNYSKIDGFDVQAGTHAIFAKSVHHITISNNIAHDSGLSGVGVVWSEFITIEGNETYGNAFADWGSGISVWEPRNITGDTTTTGYRTIVRNNISHDNVQHAGNRTDGNGIIIDDFHHGQNPGWPAYNYPTLVDGNLVYSNGGKGIAVHWSDYVTVSNNTAYHNNLDNGNVGTWRGELSQQDSSNNVWVNNIAVADPGANPNNTAIGFYGSNSATQWLNNITYNGTPGQASMNLQGGNNPAPTAANGNKLGVNPLFVDAAHDNFHVQAGSPAIDSGTSKFGLNSIDLDGGTRVVGAVDIGAYERGSGSGPAPTNIAPVAVDDSGFHTSFNSAVTISAATLLANDTDANGDTLSIASVGTARNGTVKLDVNGNVIFTPNAGISGAGQFDYKVTDGHGGTDSATVSLTIDPAGTPPTNPAVDTFSFWDSSDTPAVVADPDNQAVTLGMKFLVEVDGEIDALRFYKGPANTGPHSATLWTDTGQKISTVTFTSETAQGWQQADLGQPVAVTGGQTYVVSYNAPNGGYSVSENFFGAPLDIGPLTALPNGGVYSYGNAGAFPTQTYRASNYWVDVVFDPADTGGGTPPPPPAPGLDAIGEAGTVSVSQSGSSGWRTVTFSEALTNPSVVMGGASSNDSDPLTIHVRNVTDTGFQFQIDEWDYQDGSHGNETISWVAIEQGVHTLENGMTVEAGSSLASGRASTVSLTAGTFSTAPVVLAQVASTNQPNAVTDRISSITATKFNVELDRQESQSSKQQGAETLDWIAFESGGTADTGLVTGRSGNVVDNAPHVIDFAGAFGATDYAFVTDMQTRNGGDTAEVRLSSLNTTSASVFVEEEQSKDAELLHTTESVGYFGADIGLIY